MSKESIENSSDSKRTSEQGVDPSRLMANVTHELKTPLHSILTVAELLANQIDGKLNEEQFKQVDIIKRNGEILLGLINDLLTFSASTSSKRNITIRRFEPIKYIESICETIKPIAAEKSIELVIRLENNIKPFFSDKVLLQRILTNLLSNSLKFSKANTQIAVDAWLTKDNTLNLQVSDAGVGMDKETKHKAFAEFYQAQSNDDRSAGGVGLGLSLVRDAVKELDGKIEIQSEEGQGTLICVSIPSLIERVTGRKLFVFTADPTIETILNECLNHEGYSPKCYSEESDFFNIIVENKPDILFLDLDSCNTRAEEIIISLREILNADEVPIIAISSMQLPGIRAKCFSAGITDFLVKPFDITELLARLHTHLDK